MAPFARGARECGRFHQFVVCVCAIGSHACYDIGLCVQAGYRDGILEGKDIALQGGFNRGYEEGCRAGREMGRLRGMIRYDLFFSFFGLVVHVFIEI